MVYNPTTNQLIVHNTPTNLALLEKQLAELDVTPKQVSIEAKFITIAVTDQNKTGFTWEVTQSDLGSRPRQIADLQDSTYQFDVNGDGALEDIPFYTRPDGTNVINNVVTQGVMNALINPLPATNTFRLSGIITDNADGDTLNVTLNYLLSQANSELLSAPRVTTLNRKPAIIADIQTQTFNTNVYSELQTSEAGFGGTPVVASAQQLEFTRFIYGITLSVTPSITGGDQVRLWLNPQVTTLDPVSDQFPVTTIVNGNRQEATVTWPRERIQSVWTNVIVHDGDTLVLGGLIRDDTSHRDERVPYIGDIPVLGYFFRGKSKVVQQSSLLIFVTTDIIDTTGARYFESTASQSSEEASAPASTPASTVTTPPPASQPTQPEPAAEAATQ
ncbi:MAG TPA: hypothetical protein PK975_08200 [Candidatus Hydrogenedentes bacterium]|nr:hypothetical protein [Candidatus Hydrogenedentota bacterium]